jgi:hypothetical protein
MGLVTDITPGGAGTSPTVLAGKGVIAEMALRAQEPGVNPNEMVRGVFTSCAAMLLVNRGATVEQLHAAIDEVSDALGA